MTMTQGASLGKREPVCVMGESSGRQTAAGRGDAVSALGDSLALGWDKAQWTSAQQHGFLGCSSLEGL